MHFYVLMFVPLVNLVTI